AQLDADVLPFDVTETAQAIAKKPHRLRRVWPAGHQNADDRHLRLRDAGKRPRRRAGYSEDQVAAVHSMTSSARARRDCGTVRPSAWAVFRLMTSSNLVGCCTGRLAGFSPLRIFPA